MTGYLIVVAMLYAAVLILARKLFQPAKLRGKIDPDKGANIVVLLVATAAATAVLTYYGVDATYSSYQSQALIEAEVTWPMVQGTIESGQIEVVTAKNRPEQWHAAWRYSYRVGDRDYVANNEDLRAGYSNLAFATQAQAIAYASKRPVGGEVPVFFDPANPARSVLDRISDGRHQPLSLGISIFFFLCALIMFLFFVAACHGLSALRRL